MKETKTMPNLLSFSQLRNRGVLLSRRQVDRLEAQGKFPKRVQISEWRVAWAFDEINAWVAAKIAARAVLRPNADGAVPRSRAVEIDR